MSYSIKCDCCRDTMFPGKQLYCHTCFNRLDNLKAIYEKKIEELTLEIANLIKKLEKNDQ